jgi:hypothetical protein
MRFATAGIRSVAKRKQLDVSSARDIQAEGNLYYYTSKPSRAATISRGADSQSAASRLLGTLGFVHCCAPLAAAPLPCGADPRSARVPWTRLCSERKRPELE